MSTQHTAVRGVVPSTRSDKRIGVGADVRIGAEIRVRGLVQGVGFRPGVWRLAHACHLVGDVCNDSDGVLIRAWGERGHLEQFLRRVRHEAPPLARIDAIERRPLGEALAVHGFRIKASRRGNAHTGIVPDAATCPACRAETLDPTQRRYRYPFTNCTHCGPRLSIVGAIPYDRANTSMAGFPLCTDCRAEYEDPNDRRFHAQAIACPQCGPRVSLERSDGTPVAIEPPRDALSVAQELLLQGAIVAVKGIGGFQLACDATNADSVRRLRERKRRDAKPFALMAGDLKVIERYCAVSKDECALLADPAAPIVLCATRGHEPLPPAIAPGTSTLGFMLPYTPLHHLLLHGLQHPIVLTSGNVSDEPQCIADQDARLGLKGIADYLLLHDREIVNRVDDSVLRVVDGASRMLRRGRGYAPATLPLPEGFAATSGFADAPSVIALGGELKNTFCMIKDGNAIISQHQGDLDDGATHRDYRNNLARYQALFEQSPRFIAVDKHPEYLSTKLGVDWSEREGIPLIRVQHHHAHIASCLAENGVALDAPAVLGVALDGLGMGEQGELWGGEFVLADYRRCTRLASLSPVAMIGGAQAMREPWRNTYAHIVAAMGWNTYRTTYGQLRLTRFLEQKPLRTLDAMLTHGVNTPLASSCGRLFDAVAAAVGICRERASYEGQAAVLLEAAASAIGPSPESAASAYPFTIQADGEDLLRIDASPMWHALLRDLAEGQSAGMIAARFHHGLASAVVAMVSRLREHGQAFATASDANTVALSGGVFQNKLLFELVASDLRRLGFIVLSQCRVPANDGGLSLGQAVVAAAQTLASPTAGR